MMMPGLKAEVASKVEEREVQMEGDLEKVQQKEQFALAEVEGKTREVKLESRWAAAGQIAEATALFHSPQIAALHAVEATPRRQTKFKRRPLRQDFSKFCRLPKGPNEGRSGIRGQ